jgi:hypothetical protein
VECLDAGLEDEAALPEVGRRQEHDEIPQAANRREVLDVVLGDHVELVGVLHEVVLPVESERVEQLTASPLGEEQKAHVVEDVEGVEVVEVHVLDGPKGRAHDQTCVHGTKPGYNCTMYLVAIAELATSVEEEMPLLARDLGVAAYEARLLLAGERPKIVLRTPEEARARDLLAGLRERRHGAVACDSKAVVATDAMVQLGGFRFSDTALTNGDGDELPFSDLLAILRAVRSVHTTKTTQVKERKLAVGSAIATGGLILSKKTTREVQKHEETREQHLYLFRKSGATAWLVREQGTSYSGLGDAMAPSLAENFSRLLAELRRRAPDAVFDDRLVRFHGADALAADARLDEQVHVLALAIARLGRGPYR